MMTEITGRVCQTHPPSDRRIAACSGYQ